MTVVVIGGGMAGVAAAVAARQGGRHVVLLERSRILGGEAVRDGHRTLCGLAPIDAAFPDLLEPELTGPWVPRLTTGAPFRRGRVWLWPTHPGQLLAGLTRGLADAGVEVHLGVEARLGAEGLVEMTTGNLHPRTVIDASGMALAQGRHRPPAQWGACRLELTAPIEDTPEGQRRALRRLAHLTPWAALESLGSGRWQLSLDIPDPAPATTQDCAEAAVAALGGILETPVVTVASRDAGGYAGISMADLFDVDQRGLAWAAWPSEVHEATGVRWTWPPRDRHGMPLSLVKPADAPPWLWCCGRGLAAAPDAAGALRVTGTALALGSALGRLVSSG